MNNITAQDLMIGDIVDVHRSECVADGGHYMEWNEYGKVVSITEDYITIKYNGREDDYGFEDVEEKDIEPIPLTSDILEKNGFEAFDYFLKIQISTTYIELRPIQDSMIIWFDWDENNDGAFADIILPYPKYLHELQHALRLCGIDKKIKL